MAKLFPHRHFTSAMRYCLLLSFSSAVRRAGMKLPPSWTTWLTFSGSSTIPYWTRLAWTARSGSTERSGPPVEYAKDHTLCTKSARGTAMSAMHGSTSPALAMLSGRRMNTLPVTTQKSQTVSSWRFLRWMDWICRPSLRRCWQGRWCEAMEWMVTILTTTGWTRGVGFRRGWFLNGKRPGCFQKHGLRRWVRIF